MPTETFIATKDNQIDGAGPTINRGTQIYDTLAAWSFGDSRKILSFDISSLPSGAIINSATLSCYYYQAFSGTPTGKNVILYKLRRNDWHETESTWNIYKTGNNWGTAGASNTSTDIDTSLTDTSVMPNPNNWLEFDAKDIVEDAITNSINVNVLIKFETEGGSDTTAAFRTREYTTDTSLRPKLVIEYTLPTVTFSVSDTISLAESIIATIVTSITFLVQDTITLLESIRVKRMWEYITKNVTNWVQKAKKFY